MNAATGWFLILVLPVTSALFTGTVAHDKGYERIVWMLGGFFTGPIGFFAAVGLPDKKLRRDVRSGFEDLKVLGIDTRPQSYPPVKKGPFNKPGDLPAPPPL